MTVDSSAVLPSCLHFPHHLLYIFSVFMYVRHHPYLPCFLGLLKWIYNPHSQIQVYQFLSAFRNIFERRKRKWEWVMFTYITSPLIKFCMRICVSVFCSVCKLKLQIAKLYFVSMTSAFKLLSTTVCQICGLLCRLVVLKIKKHPLRMDVWLTVDRQSGESSDPLNIIAVLKHIWLTYIKVAFFRLWATVQIWVTKKI